MFKYFTLASVFVVLLGLSSCDKDRKEQHKCAGVWLIEQLDQSHYSEGKMDSIRSIKNVGTLVLVDHDADLGSAYLTPDQNAAFLPRFIDLTSNGSERLFWDLDNHSFKRMTFVTIGEFTDYSMIYQVNKRKRNQMELQFVDVDPLGNMKLKEIIRLRRK